MKHAVDIKQLEMLGFMVVCHLQILQTLIFMLIWKCLTVVVQIDGSDIKNMSINFLPWLFLVVVSYIQ